MFVQFFSNLQVPEPININRCDAKLRFDEQDDDPFSLTIPPELSERDSDESTALFKHSGLEKAESLGSTFESNQPEKHGPLRLSNPIHSFLSSNLLGKPKDPRPDSARLKFLPHSFPSPVSPPSIFIVLPL